MKFNNQFFLLIIFLFLLVIQLINAEITVRTEDLTEEILIEKLEKTYELNPVVLENGFLTNVSKNNAFRIPIQGKYYYLIIFDVSESNIFLIVSGDRKLILNLNQAGVIDINQDDILDIEVFLNQIADKKAEINIKKFVEEKPPIGDYIQLFDIDVSLIESTVYNSNELNMFIKFTNFGEGPSKLDIEYSIFDENNTEIYRGVDSKVVYTTDSILKNFGFLDLSPGNYSIVARIDYGENQTAESQSQFEIIKIPLLTLLRGPLIFILIIILFFIFINLSHKHYENKKILKQGKKIYKKYEKDFIRE